MSYYNSNYEPPEDRFNSSPDHHPMQPTSADDESGRFGTNQTNPQQPLPHWRQRLSDSNQKREEFAKNYNNYLERQGIPAITTDDLRILQECGRESLIYRCLPITAALCGGIVFTARTRQWNPRFYHYLGAVFVGYFTGKLSYRSVCEDRLIKSQSNSPFVNAIRKRKGIFVEEFDQGNLPANNDGSMQSDWTTPSQKSYGLSEFDDDKDSTSFGGHRNAFGSNSEPYGNRRDFGFQPETDLPPESHMPNNTYDDLRARNRSSFKNI